MISLFNVYFNCICSSKWQEKKMMAKCKILNKLIE